MKDRPPSTPEVQHQGHLRELKEEALRLGASDATVITTSLIHVEPDLIEMCKPPLCEGYGKSAHCPPHVMPPEEAGPWLSSFSWAVLFKTDVDPEVLLSDGRFQAFRPIYTLCSILETRSKDMGYDRSTGLAAGSCKAVFCMDQPCEALKPRGRCRFPLLARPSMEALGINVFRLVKALGWEIYPILKESNPKDIPKAMLSGLVLVS